MMWMSHQYQVIEDESTRSQLRESTKYNRQVASRLLGHDEYWPEESIFISIASFRDPECAKTLSRAFDRATDPNRVAFGIFQQNAEVDVDCVAGLADLVDCPGHAVCGRVHNGQIRAHRVHWSKTLGPTIARHLSERLYRDETYVLSFDSHSNFARGWVSQCLLDRKTKEIPGCYRN